MLNYYMQYLNSNTSLYQAIKYAEQNHHALTEEGLRAARFFRNDLEKGGIHLSSGKGPFFSLVPVVLTIGITDISYSLDREIGSS